jgi:chloramphenicol 3-O-phosphotransferase
MVAMTAVVGPGRIVFVTGPSGVGKTTVGRTLREILGHGWLFWEADRCQPACKLEPSADWTSADLERAMTMANLCAIRAYADAGFDVVAELLVSYPDSPAAIAEHLGDLDVTVVLLIAERNTVLARISQRTSTVDLTWAARFLDALDWAATPSDVMIDTTDRDAADVASQIAAALD